MMAFLDYLDGVLYYPILVVVLVEAIVDVKTETGEIGVHDKVDDAGHSVSTVSG